MGITRQSLSALEAHVLAVLTRHDPEGLIRLGAPTDEYEPEARDLAYRLTTGQPVTNTVLLEVWTAWFGDTAHLAHHASETLRTRLVQDLANLT